MSGWMRMATFGVWCMLLASAIGVVWSRHETRSLFIQLQGLHSERDALDIAWGQLKIEQSWWASHGRVEQTARSGLKMVIPRPDEVRLVDAGQPSGAQR